MSRPATERRTRRAQGTPAAAGDIRRYEASDMDTCLRQVVEDLGRDAVILHTRTFTRRGFLGLFSREVVEITAGPASAAPADRSTHEPAARSGAGRDEASPQAEPRAPSARAGAATGDRAAEPAHAASAASPAAIRARRAYGGPADPFAPDDDVERLAGDLAELKTLVRRLYEERGDDALAGLTDELRDAHAVLTRSGTPDGLARDLVRRCARDLAGDLLHDPAAIRARLREEVTAAIGVSGGVRVHPERCTVLALIGPTGVGKTTTAAKLAANFRLSGRRPALLTVDNYRIGAVEQLRTYADILDTPLEVCLTPRDLERAVAEHRRIGTELVILDTAGRSQRDGLRLRELECMLQAARPDETHLVVSAAAAMSAGLSAVERFGGLGADRLLVTKLDECMGYGGLLELATAVHLPFSYVTTGQDVPADIETADAGRLARLVLGESWDDEDRPPRPAHAGEPPVESAPPPAATTAAADAPAPHETPSEPAAEHDPRPRPEATQPVEPAPPPADVPVETDRALDAWIESGGEPEDPEVAA